MNNNELGIKPLFMFGFERSGTTLLSMMVGAHPQIAVPLSSTGLWYRYKKMIDTRYNSLLDLDSVRSMISDLLQEERIQMWDIEFSESDLLSRINIANYASVVAAFHTVYAEKMGKQYWANIDIKTLYLMDEANQWFPDAKFLHIVRDGRDVALSHQTYKYGLSTITEVADRWRQDLHTNLKMGSILGLDRYKVIRYEDLIIEPTQTLKDICTFIGVKYNDEMLDYPRMVKKKIPKARRFLWPDLTKPPKKSNAFKWKTSMGQTKRIVFERQAHDMLKQFGYDVFCPVPKRVSAYFYEIWCYLCQGGRLKRFRKNCCQFFQYRVINKII